MVRDDTIEGRKGRVWRGGQVLVRDRGRLLSFARSAHGY